VPGEEDRNEHESALRSAGPPGVHPLGSILRNLMSIQERLGWLPEEELVSLARRLRLPLHRIESLSTFYTHFRRTPPRAAVVDVCRDVPCRLAGAAAIRRALEAHADFQVREVSCLGRCDRAPALAVGPRSFAATPGDPALEEAVRVAIAEPQARSRPTRRWAADPYADPSQHYEALRRALRGEAADTIAAIDAAGLRGMGGAGFPTARKWSFVAGEDSPQKHVICNADESEPGTFKDREILHDLPHLVIEGMALAAHAVGARRGTVFIRHEYAPERERLEAALEAARTRGALGPKIFGTSFDFEIEVFVSPGGYILGEETALLECLEDRRGEPRNKPPFPGQRGLYGAPTLINNVETLAHASAICCRGVDWWNALGTRGRAGHKFLSVSGDVAEPGVVLVPLGTTLGELLDRCGGVRDGAALAAVAPGGASSRLLPASALDVPIDFESLAEAGSMLGSGAAIFVASGRSLVDVGLDLARFFRNESCGKCVPCRVGTEKAVALVEQQGTGPEVRKELRALHHTLERTSICGLGQVALSPLLSVLEGELASAAPPGDHD